MSLKEIAKGERLHSRSMDIATYTCDDDHIVVEGSLKDDRLVDTYDINGEKRLPQIVHHMAIRMKIDCRTLTIKDIGADMPRVPHHGCDQTAESLNRLKGIRISPGFTSTVKRFLGGKKGCLHLTTLILAMAPAILQGFWIHRCRQPGPRLISEDMLENYLIDSCRVWRRDGELAGSFLKKVPSDTDSGAE